MSIIRKHSRYDSNLSRCKSYDIWFREGSCVELSRRPMTEEDKQLMEAMVHKANTRHVSVVHDTD